MQVHLNLYQMAYHHPFLDHKEVKDLDIFHDLSHYQIHGCVPYHLDDQNLIHSDDLHPYAEQEKQNLHGFYSLEQESGETHR